MPCYSLDGLTPVVHPDAFIHPDAVLIGDVIVRASVYVAAGSVMRGDFGRLVLEEGANFQDNCVMHGFPQTDTIVEKDGHIGHGAILHGCHVGENALIGMNSVIMDGAEIGGGSIVAAMSFIKAGAVIPPRSLVAGIPGKIVREISDEELKWKSAATKEYQELAAYSARNMAPAEPLTTEEPGRKRLKLSHLPPLYKAKGG